MGELLPRIYLIVDALWRRRYLIALPILLMPIAGAVVSLMSDKQYASHTSMLVQETASLNPFLEDLAVSANVEGRMEALTTLLHSRHVLSEVAIEQGLMFETDSPQRKEQVIARLSSALTVRQVGKDLIRIDYKSTTPQGMSQLLETVSKHFIEQLLAPERSSIQESERFLREHLSTSSIELEEAEQALANYRTLHSDGLPEQHAANTERLSRVRQRLIEREAELAGAKQSLGSIDQQLSRTNPVLTRLEEQIVLNRAELATLMSRYTEGHSKVLAIKRVLRHLEQEREEVLALPESAVSKTDSSALLQQQISITESNGEMLIVQVEALMIARQRVDALAAEVSQLKSLANSIQQQIGSVGEQEKQLRILNRNLRVKRSLYENMLTRYEMAQVTGALGVFEQADRIKIIDRAYTPSGPSTLPLWMFVVAGFVGGIAIGISLAMIAELTDSSLRTIKDIEAIAGVSVLSRIPPLNESH
ncbi:MULTISPECIES: Wzz/FepE/Etk N-terminal domain-containing protein [unclassified Agarivorans]|uniref:Wzz/FepE/Etk N-terminal domain-containing protein n=1 Tax=unclassified Agarivorans TaxID=2636026 RepID=UPI0026E1D050|nr:MULTISPECIES: Wzz/FepE/Etk N-terminal domain-containing protein [unclassified Agarivorans]MDO6687010.1 Wzz/FepE/Etk N-terminal domain-containing protein [Agarivorans sp. 3_MG-2023]MDO6713578.1 Wzz/FepE/Etk N-terminal domain-containing protein [Agarivorans sp. 2_MG-2023]